MKLFGSWQMFAIGSAFFAALTAIFGKLGVAGINSNLATFVRTVVILIIIGAIVSIRVEWERPDALSASSVCFLILSGAATGLSWLCYYRALQLGPVSMIAPVDKLSVALAIGLGLVFLGEPLTWQVAVGGLLIVAGSVVILMA